MLSTELFACESLIVEHRQVEVLLEKLQNALDQQDYSVLKSILAELTAEMNTHFACEEQALFPAVEPYHSMVLMEVEHEMLVGLREELSAQLVASDLDWPKITNVGTQFVQEMLDHIGREDAGIFPACERSLSETEKSDVIESMQAIRQAAQQNPTPSIQRPERFFKAMQANLNQPLVRPIFAERLSEGPIDNSIQEIKHLSLQAGQALAAHWSPKAITLICLQGIGQFIANDQSVALQPGAVVTMTPRLNHAVKAQTDCHFLLLLST